MESLHCLNRIGVCIITGFVFLSDITSEPRTTTKDVLVDPALSLQPGSFHQAVVASLCCYRCYSPVPLEGVEALAEKSLTEQVCLLQIGVAGVDVLTPVSV